MKESGCIPSFLAWAAVEGEEEAVVVVVASVAVEVILEEDPDTLRTEVFLSQEASIDLEYLQPATVGSSHSSFDAVSLSWVLLPRVAGPSDSSSRLEYLTPVSWPRQEHAENMRAVEG